MTTRKLAIAAALAATLMGCANQPINYAENPGFYCSIQYEPGDRCPVCLSWKPLKDEFGNPVMTWEEHERVLAQKFSPRIHADAPRINLN